jgi:hypothetical protein
MSYLQPYELGKPVDQPYDSRYRAVKHTADRFIMQKDDILNQSKENAGLVVQMQANMQQEEPISSKKVHRPATAA